MIWLDRTSVKRILSDIGVAPRRRMGQSFLVDRAAAARIIEALQPNPEDVIVEIGPGLGALTAGLIHRVRRLVAIELDRRLAAFLAKRFEKEENFELIQADALQVDLSRLLARLRACLHVSGRIRLAGNLPYRVATQILMKLFESGSGEQTFPMIFAFQWEVARRLVAGPGTANYGVLSIITSYYSRPELLIRIKKSAFYPQPEVDTGIVRFSLPSQPTVPLEDRDRDGLFSLIKQSFSQRRKMVKNALTKPGTLPYTEALVEKALAMCRLDSKVRAEDLSLDDYVRIFLVLNELKRNGF